MLTRKTSQISMMRARASPSARTLASISSRSTAVPGSCSRILITLTSLLSCFVTCSSGLGLDVDDDRHARQPFGLRGTDRERVDVEPARREQAGHAREHAGPVLDQHRDRVQCVVGSLMRSVPPRGRSWAGSPSGPRMMSSFEAPEGTMGNTISRRIDPEVDHDAAVGDRVGLLDRGVDLVGRSTRRPTAP